MSLGEEIKRNRSVYESEQRAIEQQRNEKLRQVSLWKDHAVEDYVESCFSSIKKDILNTATHSHTIIRGTCCFPEKLWMPTDDRDKTTATVYISQDDSTQTLYSWNMIVSVFSYVKVTMHPSGKKCIRLLKELCEKEGVKLASLKLRASGKARYGLISWSDEKQFSLESALKSSARVLVNNQYHTVDENKVELFFVYTYDAR